MHELKQNPQFGVNTHDVMRISLPILETVAQAKKHLAKQMPPPDTQKISAIKSTDVFRME